LKVLITGSSNGLGRSLAWKFAQPGNTVILHGRNESRLEVFERILREDRGAVVETVIGDICEADTIQRLWEAGKRHQVDILINNAGMHDGSITAILAVNLGAPILLTQGLYPTMKKRGSGLIVNINSLAGKTFNAEEAVYCASKWGLRGYMGSIRYEARQHGVGVLDIYPGAMQTDMKFGHPDYDSMMDPDEVAEVIYNACRDYPTLRVNEIEIGRRA
jgi:3-oxoacyl-[acyl-carrier protein] reductase